MIRKIRSLGVWFMALVVMVGCTAFGQSQQQSQQWPPTEHPENPDASHYTPPASYRAALLEQVRAEEEARKQAKQGDDVFTIVANGQPQATIVAGEDAQEAANLLNDWIEMMSGATLPVATEAQEGQPAIFLGQKAQDNGLDLSDIESTTDEGIRVRATDMHAYIGWQSGAAPSRAVGRFLEEQFGCRWFASTDWGKVYPEQKTLRVHAFEISEKPEALFRRIWGAEGAFGGAPGWHGWVGHGGRQIATSHDWGFLTDEDFEENPEMFRMNAEGERVNDSSHGVWPNWGNEEARRRFIEYAVEKSDNGQAFTISLSPPDSYKFDHSPEAKKYDNPDVIVPSSGRVSMTDRFVGIVNEAAEAIYEEGQRTIVGFYAYSDYTLPPTKPELDNLSPNLCVMIAPIRYSRFHPLGHPNSESRQRLKSIVDGWASATEMMGYRTYNFNLAENLTPFVKLSVWSHDLPYLYNHGCIAYNLESFDSWEIAAPHLYLSIRLSYDPSQNPWKIMADYWHKMYGPAAEPMQNYWMTLDQRWANLETESGSLHSLPNVFTPEMMSELGQYIEQAQQAAQGNERVAQRVELAARGYRRAQYWRDWFDAMNAGDIEQAKHIFDEWVAYVQASREAGNANDYDLTYLNRFVGGITNRAYNAVHPEEGAANEIVMVLPDQWQYANADMLDEMGVDGEPTGVDFDDSNWDTVATYSNTLNGQGYPEYFGAMWYRTSIDVPASASENLALRFVKADRKITVFVNGEQVNEEEVEGFGGATIDVSGHVQPGQSNHVTVKIRHIPLPELYLGGIVAPVYLIDQGE